MQQPADLAVAVQDPHAIYQLLRLRSWLSPRCTDVQQSWIAAQFLTMLVLKRVTADACLRQSHHKNIWRGRDWAHSIGACV
jgi:hypothetical protein